MDKNDWFWVFVKVAGLGAMFYAFTVLTTMLTLFGDMPFGSMLWRLIVQVGVIGLLGVWLVRDGRVLAEWARRSDSKPDGR